MKTYTVPKGTEVIVNVDGSRNRPHEKTAVECVFSNMDVLFVTPRVHPGAPISWSRSAGPNHGYMTFKVPSVRIRFGDSVCTPNYIDVSIHDIKIVE